MICRFQRHHKRAIKQSECLNVCLSAVRDAIDILLNKRFVRREQTVYAANTDRHFSKTKSSARIKNVHFACRKLRKRSYLFILLTVFKFRIID